MMARSSLAFAIAARSAWCCGTAVGRSVDKHDIIAAEHLVRLTHDVVFVGHGLSSDTRAMLIDGTTDAVITQNTQTSLMDCVAIFANLRTDRAAVESATRSGLEIILRENLP
jgi:hypothetical protein